MKKSNDFLRIALVLSLFVGASFGQTVFKYSLVPPRAKPDSGFALWLLSESFTCASVFSFLSIDNSTPKQITLSFLAKEDSSIRCTQSPGAVYGPKFQISALKTGIYNVIANRKYPCQVIPPFCNIPERMEPAGLLKVEDGTGWFIKPREVKAGMKFDLQLLHEKYGNCNYSFNSLSFKEEVKGITLGSKVEYDPTKICILDIHPFGPTYSNQALKAGQYPIYVSVLEFDTVAIALGPVDTLTVLAPTSLVSKAVKKKTTLFHGGRDEVQGHKVNGRKPFVKSE